MVQELEYERAGTRVGEPLGLKVMRWIAWGVMGASTMAIVVVLAVRPERMNVWVGLAFCAGLGGYVVRVAAVVMFSMLKMRKAREWRGGGGGV